MKRLAISISMNLQKSTFLSVSTSILIRRSVRHIALLLEVALQQENKIREKVSDRKNKTRLDTYPTEKREVLDEKEREKRMIRFGWNLYMFC